MDLPQIEIGTTSCSVGNPAEIVPKIGCLSKAGYRTIRIHKTDPYFGMGYKYTKNGDWNWLEEQRYVMAKHLGRTLKGWELVHHKNHNKLDNRPENLELISRTIDHLGETIAHTRFLEMEAKLNRLETFYRITCEAYRDGRIIVKETPAEVRAKYLAEKARAA